MDQGDVLAYGVVFLLYGVAAVLVTLHRRYKVAVLPVGILILLCQGMMLAQVNVRVPWGSFTEVCVITGGLLIGVALVRTARLIMAGDDKAW